MPIIPFPIFSFLVNFISHKINLLPLHILPSPRTPTLIRLRRGNDFLNFSDCSESTIYLFYSEDRGRKPDTIILRGFY